MNEYIKNSLSEIYQEGELNSIRFMMYEHFCGLSVTQLLTGKQTRLSEGEMVQFFKAVKRLMQHEPIQYILGETQFYGLPFLVNSSVLIPRPETEELVALILHESPNQTGDVIDFCCGSGCISIALKHNRPQWTVYGLDKFSECLDVSSQNANRNQCEVNWIQKDIFEYEDSRKFDIIVSNPPYVAMKEKSQIADHVMNYEPHSALFVPDDDALVFYRHILTIGRKILNENGKVYFEINPFYADSLKDLARSYDYKEVVIVPDIHNRKRFLKAKFSSNISS